MLVRAGFFEMYGSSDEYLELCKYTLYFFSLNQLLKSNSDLAQRFSVFITSLEVFVHIVIVHYTFLCAYKNCYASFTIKFLLFRPLLPKTTRIFHYQQRGTFVIMVG